MDVRHSYREPPSETIVGNPETEVVMTPVSVLDIVRVHLQRLVVTSSFTDDSE